MAYDELVHFSYACDFILFKVIGAVVLFVVVCVAFRISVSENEEFTGRQA